MDKKFLTENNLMEDYRRFMRLCEWSYVPSTLEEDGEDEDIPQEPQAPMDVDMQGGDNAMGDAPQDANNMPQQDGMGQGEDMMNGDMNQDMPIDNGMGQEQPMIDDPMIGADELNQEDEEVIDVDDLTNAQEKMNDKVNTVGKDLDDLDDKIAKLMNYLDNINAMIDNNNKEIQAFKDEFEKRNPTQTERLNLRSLDAYPYAESPKKYWDMKNKDENSNYSAYFDNDEPTSKEYKITNNDVDDFTEREIADSFNTAKDLDFDIKRIFGL